jgi:uncharacterized membrane protein
MKLRNIVQSVLLVTYLVISILSYFYLPTTVVTHWGADGQPNGTMSKEMNSLTMIGMLLFLYVLLKFAIRLDPKKENIYKFIDSYEWFINIMLFFFIILNVFVTMWNLGYQVPIMYFMIPMFSILQFGLGYLLANAKQNYSIGIRTPWTLADSEVWDKTHKLGSKLFYISGVLCLFGMLSEMLGLIFMIFPLLLIVMFLFGYSYYLYIQKAKKSVNN